MPIKYHQQIHHQVRHKNSQREVMCFRAYVLEMLSHLKGHMCTGFEWRTGIKINTNSMYLDASPSFQITRQCQNLEDCVGLFCDLACLPDVLLCLRCMSASYSYPREYCSNLNCAIAKKLVGWANIILIPRINLLVRPFARHLVSSLDHSNEAECLLKSRFEQ